MKRGKPRLHYLAVVLALLSIYLYALPPALAQDTPRVYSDLLILGDYERTGQQFSADRAAAPVLGEGKVLVIPVQFSDVKATVTPERATEKGVAMRGYWQEVSYGKFATTASSLSRWLDLPQSLGYYGRDEPTSEDVNIVQMVREAIAAADPLVDFKGFSYVMIVHAGLPQESSDVSSDIWSKAIWRGNFTTQDGVTIERIAIISRQSPLGTWAHEFGHLLGLPDLYNYDRLSGTPDNFLGDWDLMASGGWNGLPGNRGASPAHLTSWGKLKLGWLEATSVQEVPPRTEKMVELSFLTAPAGTRALRIAGTSPLYYLIEARVRSGYDLYLPGEGLLVLQIDEGRDSGKGAVRVVLAPGMADLDGAAVGVGAFLEVREASFWVTTLSRLPTAFSARVNYSPPIARLTLKTGVPGLSLTVDGKPYTADQAGDLSLQLVAGVSYTFTVPQLIPVSAGERLNWVRWSDGSTQSTRSLSFLVNTTLSLVYQRQFLLTLTTPYGSASGGGWYNLGSAALVNLDPTVVPGGEGTRFLFQSWQGDVPSAQATSPTLSLVMDSPRTLTARWQTQHRLQVTDPFPEDKSGWYAQGTLVSLQVSSPRPIAEGTRQVFLSWSGDVSSTQPQIAITMNAPKKVTARWQTQHQVELVLLNYDGSQPLSPLPEEVVIEGSRVESRRLTDYSGLWLEEDSWRLVDVQWQGASVAPLELSWQLSSPQSWVIDNRVYPLNVIVLGKRGQPLQDARVRVERDGKLVADLVANARGRAELAQVPPIPHRVRVSYKGFSGKFVLAPQELKGATPSLTLPVYLEVVGLALTLKSTLVSAGALLALLLALLLVALRLVRRSR